MPSRGLAQACTAGRLDNEDLPRWTKKATAQVCSQTLDDHGGLGTISLKSITWRNTDFLRHVVGDRQRQRCKHFFTYVCEHRTVFPVEDFPWQVTAHGERKKKEKRVRGWWCGASGEPCDWEKPNRLSTLPIGDTTQEQVIFPAVWIQMESVTT